MDNWRRVLNVDDYVSLFLNSSISAFQPEVFLSIFLLALGRILPIIALSPFFGARVLPHPVKVTFAICLFVVFLPAILANVTSPVEFNTRLIVLMLKEIFIGFSIGFIISAPFSIVQSVGIIIDHQRGGASLMVNDPTIQNQSSPLGTLYNMTLIVLFYYIDGPFYVMNGIISSYEIMPPDRLLSESFFTQSNDFWKIQFSLLNRIMVLSAQLAAPPLIVILMTDVFLGIANRLAPQVQITFLGMALKSLLALLVVYLGWRVYNEQTITEVYRWLYLVKDGVNGLVPGS